ncbi:MAG: tetratricopeptide repeat protein [Gammaproteobacteria bacterium]|nr:tetratricopeptide repeat protein [Gammaproteobacteria bacterium]
MNLSNGFRIGDWDVLPLEGRIVRAANGHSETRRVRRKAMDVLCALAAQSGQVVERDDLLAAVWGRTAVTDEPLTSTIGELRRLLGENQGERRYIETIPKRGYRLLAAVEPLATAPAVPPATTEPMEQTTVPATRRRPIARFDWKVLVAVPLVLAAALFAWQRLTVPDAAPIPDDSIAVLPFEDLSPQGNQDYFAEGLAEELITLLTRVPALRVAARNSAFSFRGENLAVEQIAERLKVAHVLTGSVQRSGNQVRVTAQLVDARAGYQLWSDVYDRTLDDIFAIQDDIAGQVMEQLRLRLLGGELSVRETDPRAYTLYLQARHVGRQHTREGLERAAELYRQALAIDDEYLPAWNELAGVYFNLAGIVEMPRDEGFRLARQAAFKALAVDPAYAPAYDRLGWLAMYQDNDLRAAAEHYRRALELEPGNDAILSNAAVLAVALGRLDDAIALLRAGALRDPVSAVAHANLANAYLLARRYPEAERSIRNTLMLSPQYAGAHYRLARVLLAQGDLEGARQALAAEQLEAGQWLGQALLDNAEGRIAASDAALARVERRFGTRAAGNLAQVYAHRGDIERAFEWLEVEYEANGSGGFLEFRWDPLLDPLRGDPRWAALLERVGFGEAELGDVPFPAIAANYRKN